MEALKITWITARHIWQLDKQLKVGKKYKIKYTIHKNSKQGVNNFIGILIKKYDNFYLFRSINGRRESFLKVDFIIGECKIEKI